MKKILLAFLYCFFLLPIATNAEDLKYSNAKFHYAFSLPTGWVEIPKSTIDVVMQGTADMTKGTFIDYLAGFQTEDTPIFQYPYILVQQHTLNTPSYGQIAKTFEDKGFSEGINEKMEEYSELLTNASFEDPFIDKKRNIVFMNLEMDVAGVGKVKGLVAMFLGKSGIAQLNFYTIKSDYEKSLPIFNQIINSFKYEQGYEYDEEKAKSNDSVGIGGMLKRSLIGGVVGALIGLAWAFFKKKS